MLTNRKRQARRGLVQLVDATAFWTLLRKSLGAKRREVPFGRKQDILQLLADFEDGATRKVERDSEERDAVVSRVYPTTLGHVCDSPALRGRAQRSRSQPGRPHPPDPPRRARRLDPTRVRLTLPPGQPQVDTRNPSPNDNGWRLFSHALDSICP